MCVIILKSKNPGCFQIQLFPTLSLNFPWVQKYATDFHHHPQGQSQVWGISLVNYFLFNCFCSMSSKYSKDIHEDGFQTRMLIMVIQDQSRAWESSWLTIFSTSSPSSPSPPTSPLLPSPSGLLSSSSYSSSLSSSSPTS